MTSSTSEEKPSETLDSIKRGLRDRNLAKVARVTGISRQTVWSIANGLNTNPSYRTIETLSAYLRGELD